GREARLEHYRRFHVLEARDSFLELHMDRHGAGDRAHGARAHSPLVDGLQSALPKLGVSGQSQIIVGRKVNDFVAVETRDGKLLGFQNAQLLIAQLIELIGKILQLRFRHFRTPNDDSWRFQRAMIAHWLLCEGEYNAAEPQPKGGPPCPPCFSSFNTEYTESLSDLWVEAVLSTEVTETLRAQGKIFTARKEVGSWCNRESPRGRSSLLLKFVPDLGQAFLRQRVVRGEFQSLLEVVARFAIQFLCRINAPEIVMGIMV